MFEDFSVLLDENTAYNKIFNMIFDRVLDKGGSGEAL
jgi:hypothetical protein